MQNRPNNVLEHLVKQLSNLIEDPGAECAIMPDNGYDESVIIGTTDSFLSLAKTIIEFVCSATSKEDTLSLPDVERDTIFNEEAFSTNEIKKVFDELGLVWPICAYLVTDEHVRKRVTDGFKQRYIG